MYTACEYDRRLALMEIADRGLIIAQAGTVLWRTNSLLRDEASRSLVLDALDWNEPNIGTGDRLGRSRPRQRRRSWLLAARKVLCRLAESI